MWPRMLDSLTKIYANIINANARKKVHLVDYWLTRIKQDIAKNMIIVDFSCINFEHILIKQ